MTHRRVAALLVAALLLPAVACSDDDASEPPPAGAEAEVFAAVVDVAGRPSAVTVALGDLWIASHAEAVRSGAGGVERYDGDGTYVAGASVGRAPIAVVATPTGVWTVGATGELTRIDTSPGRTEPLTRVTVPGAPVDAVLAGDRLWVADIENGVVHVLDPGTGLPVAEPVAVPAGAVRLAAGAGRLWVSGLEAEVTPIDLATLAVGPPAAVGRGPIGLAVAGEVLWVTSGDDDTVSRLDATTGASLGPAIAVGPAPIAVVVDGDLLWVLEQDGPSVSVLDASTGRIVLSSVPLGDTFRPRGIAVVAQGAWIVGVEPSQAVRLPRPTARQ